MEENRACAVGRPLQPVVRLGHYAPPADHWAVPTPSRLLPAVLPGQYESCIKQNWSRYSIPYFCRVAFSRTDQCCSVTAVSPRLSVPTYGTNATALFTA